MLATIPTIRKFHSLSLNHLHHCLSLLLAAVLLVISPLNQAQRSPSPDNPSNDFNNAPVTIPEVFVHIALVQAELELIRFEMGKPRSKQPELIVSGTTPRDLFFQALTLFRKANRFSFEQTRQRVTTPDIPGKNIQPTQVYSVIDSALIQIRLVKKQLGIMEAGEVIPLDTVAIPDDVFTAIIQANRQLNLLLDRQFAPSEVFQQVTLAVGYTSQLLTQFPETTSTPPPAPPLERGKRPSDVYRLLIACYELARQIAERSGLSMLILESSESQFESVAPSDVFDIASLVVSELAYLHEQLDGAQAPHEVYYPGRKLPSHVYQRAGILESQLINLLKQVEQKPDWLRN